MSGVFGFLSLFRLRAEEALAKSAGPDGITANEARKNLVTLIEQVNEDRQAVEISSMRGDAVLMSRADDLALDRCP
jgi:hypothetical protein